MKLYELNKGDAFKYKLYGLKNSEPTNIIGTFFGMDGAYGKVQYDTIPYNVYVPFNLLHANTEVERIDE